MSGGDELLTNTKAWMLRHGWNEVSEGAAGWMWKRTAAGEDARKIAVVRNLARDIGAFNGVVQRLAAAHHKPIIEVERAVRMWGTDVTMLRAANDIVIAETIPLTAGAVMVESGRLMYRCSATASIRLRPEISGAYSKIGDELSNAVRMGHTERGSYIIPVYVKLSDPQQVVDNEQPFEGFERESIEVVESAERRMTRTFAQAMQAIHDFVLTPEHLPKAGEVMGLVSAGVTREFVSAIARVIAESAVAEFETRFEWAPSQPTPARIAKSVSIPAAAGEKLNQTVQILKRSKQREFNVMTGPIVTVSKFPGDPYVYATIKTVRGGHPCNVTAFLTGIPLKTVTEWMTSGETVQLQGVVDRHGSGLVVRSPQGFGPLALPIG